MDLTSQVLHDVEFREAKRGGYHTQDVDEFLERLAVAVDRQEAQLREARQRVAAAEGRIADAERRAEEAERRGGGGGSDADETLKRTLVLAQRTADAAIREAEEQAARTVAAAEDEAHRLVAEAHDASAAVYADAEEEARRAQHEARTRVLAELQELEGGRELLRSDVELLEQHIAIQRERLRLTIRDLTALVEDPAALREALVPTLADVTIPEPQPAPQPRRLVADPLPDEVDALDDIDDDPDWAVAAPEVAADDYEPVPAPAPRPRPTRDDRYADRPLLAASPRPEPLPEPVDDLDDDEDAYLTELRKAMTDDEPLGPRDDDDERFGDGRAPGRSRFGRRR